MKKLIVLLLVVLAFRGNFSNAALVADQRQSSIQPISLTSSQDSLNATLGNSVNSMNASVRSLEKRQLLSITKDHFETAFKRLLEETKTEDRIATVSLIVSLISQLTPKTLKNNSDFIALKSQADLTLTLLEGVKTIEMASVVLDTIAQVEGTPVPKCAEVTTTPATPPRDSDPMARLRILSDLLIKDNHYQVVHPDELDSDFSKLFEAISEFEVSYQLKKESSSHPAVTALKKTADFLVFDGVISGTIGRAIEAIPGEVLTTNHTPIPLKSLLPADDGHLTAAVRGTAGGLMIAVGVSGLVIEFASLGVPLGSTSAALLNTGIDLGSRFMEYHIKTSNRTDLLKTSHVHQAKIRHCTLTSTSDQGACLAMGAALADAGAGIAVRGLSVYGLTCQIAQGGKKITEAIIGPEEDPVLLKQYELLHKTIVLTTLEKRKKIINEVIQAALTVLTNPHLVEANKSEIHGIVESLDKASHWTHNLEKEAVAKFNARILYLDTVIIRQHKIDTTIHSGIQYLTDMISERVEQISPKSLVAKLYTFPTAEK